MIKRLSKILIGWISVLGLQLLVKTIRFLPRKLMYFIGNILSALYYQFAHKNRDIALRNLQSALGDCLPRERLQQIARESFKTMGHAVLDTVRYKYYSKDEFIASIEIEGLENLENALKKGKGVIAISAHLGSFTIMGARLALMGHKATFVARHARNKKIEHIIMNLCRQAGQKVIFSYPVLSCMRRCIKVLERNHILIIELDQNFGTEGMKVDFFGKPAMVPNGPIKLALSTAAAVVPMFIVRKPDNNHIIKIEPQVQFDYSDDLDRDVKVNLQKTIDVIEKYIRQYPGQWVNWIHKHWDVTQE